MPSPEQQPAWNTLSRIATDLARTPVAELLAARITRTAPMRR